MGKVLLVVDDSRTIRAAVEFIFEGTDYRVVTKDTGAAGLAWMESHTPDLILVDERMPDMDGYQFGTEIKSNAKNEDVPILLLACQDGPDESRADGADLDGYVNKPFGSQELLTLVEMLTGSSQISQMPLSFKEQLAHRQRQKKTHAGAAGDGAAHAGSGDLDEQLSFEAELASVANEPPKPKPKVDEPVVEIPTIEAEPKEDLPAVRIEARSPTPVPPAKTVDMLEPAYRDEPAAPVVEHEEFEEEVEAEDLTDEPEAPREPSYRDAPPHPTVPLPGPPTDDLSPRAEMDRPPPPIEPPPPPRFPPAPAAPPPMDFGLPRRPSGTVLPPLRSSPREPTPPPAPPFRAAPFEPPPPLPPIPPRPPSMPSFPIEEPEEATSPEMDVSPAFEPPIQEPELDEKSLPVVETTPIDEALPPIAPPPIASPQLPPPAPAPLSSPGMHTSDVRPQSGSRGLLFALLALAVIGGLIAFFFVSK